MDLSEFTLRLLLLLVPGLVARLIVQSLVIYCNRDPFYFGINSLILGVAAYLELFVLKAIAVWLFWLPPPIEVIFFKALSDSNQNLSFGEIALATLLGTLNGLVVARSLNGRLWFRLAELAGIKDKLQDIGVWGRLLNAKDDRMRWVVVRDHENQLAIEGWIKAFSDVPLGGAYEIFILDAKVYNNVDGRLLYETPGIYLARKLEAISLEFNALPFQKGPEL